MKVIGTLIRDPRGKFRPNWSEPYFIRELTPKGADPKGCCMVDRFRWKPILRAN